MADKEKAEKEEREKLMLVFSIYAEADHRMDGTDVVNAMRAIELNPTIGLVVSLGGSEVKGEKALTFDEFFKIYQSLKDCKAEGGFEDFVECLKIYDIGENGKMKLNDLTHMLLNLGERVTEDELYPVLDHCMLEEEDDEGWFAYLPFLCRLCERPIPKSIIPQ